MSSGYWPAERRLATLLDSHSLTPREFAFLFYVGLNWDAQPGKEGVMFDGLAGVARLLRCSEKTATRTLQHLAEPELQLVLHTLGQGKRTPFRVWLGVGALRSTSDTTSDKNPTTFVRSDLGQGAEGEAAQTVAANGFAPQATSDTRARTRETETFKKNDDVEVKAAQAFETLVGPLGTITARQRETFEAAFTANPVGFEQCVATAVGKGDSPPAYLTAMLKEDAHLRAASPSPAAPPSEAARLDKWLAADQEEHQRLGDQVGLGDEQRIERHEQEGGLPGGEEDRNREQAEQGDEHQAVS